MSNGTTGWITVLLRLPVFDNPDAAGYRASIEDDKFSGHGGRTRPPLRRRYALHLSPRPAARVLVGSRRCRSRRAGTDRGDVPDTTESRDWLRAYARDVLRERFRQKAIYLKFVGPVEHLIVSEEEVSDEN